MKVFPIVIITLVFSYCSNKPYSAATESEVNVVPAKFEPGDGECLLFIGQDLEATGGLEEYTNGYSDHFEIPTGITVYTNFSPGGESFGFYQKGNDGIKTKANWGAGDSCANCYLEDSDYQYSLIAIGLSMVNHEKEVANGKHDDLIKELGDWCKSLGQRPVFLRIGYEFDGWDWNHYNRKHYLEAWKRIHTVFQEIGVENVAFVWQSKGTGSDQKILEDWYPGDHLVDWCGYSYFGGPDEEMITFARKHNKPVFIAEATPVLQNENLYFNTDLSDPEIAQKAWKQWFQPFFQTLNENKDVVKAFSYINADWSAQPMWKLNPVFQKVDARIQESPFLTEKWEEEFSRDRYLKPDPGLWRKLHSTND